MAGLPSGIRPRSRTRKSPPAPARAREVGHVKKITRDQLSLAVSKETFDEQRIEQGAE
jgi:hypothetical protein